MAGSLKHLVFLGRIHRRSPQIVNQYGDSELICRSIFNTAGSFRNGIFRTLKCTLGVSGLNFWGLCRRIFGPPLDEGYDPAAHADTPLARFCTEAVSCIVGLWPLGHLHAAPQPEVVRYLAASCKVPTVACFFFGVGGGEKARETGTMWQIGVLTWKPCAFPQF